MKRGCTIPIIALVLVLCVAAVAITAIALFLWPRSAPQPLVLINSPRNGQELAIGEETTIHAVARSDQKIKRVELWVDGQLRDAQSSSLAGGVTPFPLVVSWQPSAPGAHTIVVRAYSSQNTRGSASINVQAVAGAESIASVAVLDECPDPPDASQPNGCSVPGDSDGDGVADASDACPREFGTAALGGCPDRDSDGVLDSTDACADAAGPSGLAGCPDRDGDGVRDLMDLCPDLAGPVTNSGCPPTGTGDRDGDGVDDGTDLAPTEAGPADSGGAPPPGGGTDADSDGVPEAEEASEDPLSGFSFFVPDLSAFTTVEIQALEFQVGADYSQVYCYATVGNTTERIGSFSALTGRRWDIANFMGPLNARTLLWPMGQSIPVGLECSGIVSGSRESPGSGEGIGGGGGDNAYFDLGSFSRSHTITSMMIDEVTMDSSGGASGHAFRAKYRVCSPGCKTPVLRAPLVTLSHVAGQNRLAWAWAGHAYDINGFKLYMNGNYMFSIGPHNTNYLFHDVPPCGRRFDIQLSAYAGNPNRPDQESPLSNVVTWDGEICPRTANIRFLRLETGSLHGNDDWGDVGPLFGSFRAGDQNRNFESHYNLDADGGSFDISPFFPRTDFTVDLDSDDSLYVGATIKDRDPGTNPNDTIFDWEESIPAEMITAGEHRLTGRGGATLVYQIDLAPRH